MSACRPISLSVTLRSHLLYGCAVSYLITPNFGGHVACYHICTDIYVLTSDEFLIVKLLN